MPQPQPSEPQQPKPGAQQAPSPVEELPEIDPDSPEAQQMLHELESQILSVIQAEFPMVQVQRLTQYDVDDEGGGNVIAGMLIAQDDLVFAFSIDQDEETVSLMRSRV